ncbi:MAG: group 1 truncated hemoglobin [Aquabacterium sp.]|uniref:group I truncated hemoglobin n=1 Tax=Aquabacterium sp. TaxID=1872578 RepID=UPI002716DA79|nr:group 1 truncated hemoglobin [Aquabacterium sp.]MDO9004546.1 group 1 truncated hemoglobin [Aquabacterium sp.]
MKLSDLRIQLTPERKRNLITLVVGLTISWTLASLMACASSTKPSTSAPLYQQLGGVASITQITDRTLDRVSTDPRTQRTFANIKMKALKESVATYVCKVADGPCVYEGETMRNSHADLGITGAEFDLMVEVLRDEINRAQAPTGAKNELLKRLAPTRRDIVKNS